MQHLPCKIKDSKGLGVHFFNMFTDFSWKLSRFVLLQVYNGFRCHFSFKKCHESHGSAAHKRLWIGASNLHQKSHKIVFPRGPDWSPEFQKKMEKSCPALLVGSLYFRVSENHTLLWFRALQEPFFDGFWRWFLKFQVSISVQISVCCNCNTCLYLRCGIPLWFAVIHLPTPTNALSHPNPSIFPVHESTITNVCGVVGFLCGSR